MWHGRASPSEKGPSLARKATSETVKQRLLSIISGTKRPSATAAVPVVMTEDAGVETEMAKGTIPAAADATAPRKSLSVDTEALGVFQEQMGRLMASKLWASLLRGGLVQTGLVRSLSGWHTAVSPPSEIRQLLQEIVDGVAAGRAFWEACRQQRGLRTQLGGNLVDTAVRAVFAAVLHHSPGLQLAWPPPGDAAVSVSGHVLKALDAAETVRVKLLQTRQRLQVQADEGRPARGAGASMGADGSSANRHVFTCLDRAVFLLSVAAVDRRSERGARPSGAEDDLTQFFQFQRQLVLAFVTSTDLPPLDHVRAFLLQRREVALQRAQLYTTLNDQIDRAGVDSPGGLLLLRGLVCRPAANLPERPRKSGASSASPSPTPGVEHYASGLEGCGIALENEVRAAYYRFIRTLLVHAPLPSPGGGWWDARRDADNCILHGNASVYILILSMLSVQWQPYDFEFLGDAGLPLFVLAAAAMSAHEVKLLPASEAEDIAVLQQIHLLARAVLGSMALSMASWKPQRGSGDGEGHRRAAAFATAACAVSTCQVLARVTWAPEFSLFLMGLLASVTRESEDAAVHSAVARHVTTLCLTWPNADSFPTLVSLLGLALAALEPAQADLMVAEGFQFACERRGGAARSGAEGAQPLASGRSAAGASSVKDALPGEAGSPQRKAKVAWAPPGSDSLSGPARSTGRVKSMHLLDEAPAKQLLAGPGSDASSRAGQTTVDLVLSLALCDANSNNASIAGAVAGVVHNLLDLPLWQRAASDALTSTVLASSTTTITSGCAFVLEAVASFPPALVPGVEVELASTSVTHTRGRLLAACWKQGTATVGYDDGTMAYVPVHNLDFTASEELQGRRCVSAMELGKVLPRLSAWVQGRNNGGDALRTSAVSVIRSFLLHGSPEDHRMIAADVKLAQTLIAMGTTESTGLDSHWRRRELALGCRMTRGDTWQHPFLQADGTAGVPYFNCSTTFRLRLRRKPNTGSPVIGHLRPGESAVAIDKAGSWLRLQMQPGWAGPDGATEAWALSYADDRDGLTHVMLQRSQPSDASARLLPVLVRQPSLVLGPAARSAGCEGEEQPEEEEKEEEEGGEGEGDARGTVKQLSKGIINGPARPPPCSLIPFVPYSLLAATELVMRPRVEVQWAHPVHPGYTECRPVVLSNAAKVRVRVDPRTWRSAAAKPAVASPPVDKSKLRLAIGILHTQGRSAPNLEARLAAVEAEATAAAAEEGSPAAPGPHSAPLVEAAPAEPAGAAGGEVAVPAEDVADAQAPRPCITVSEPATEVDSPSPPPARDPQAAGQRVLTDAGICLNQGCEQDCRLQHFDIGSPAPSVFLFIRSQGVPWILLRPDTPEVDLPGPVVEYLFHAPAPTAAARRASGDDVVIEWGFRFEVTAVEGMPFSRLDAPPAETFRGIQSVVRWHGSITGLPTSVVTNGLDRDSPSVARDPSADLQRSCLLLSRLLCHVLAPPNDVPPGVGLKSVDFGDLASACLVSLARDTLPALLSNWPDGVPLSAAACSGVPNRLLAGLFWCGSQDQASVPAVSERLVRVAEPALLQQLLPGIWSGLSTASLSFTRVYTCVHSANQIEDEVRVPGASHVDLELSTDDPVARRECSVSVCGKGDATVTAKYSEKRSLTVRSDTLQVKYLALTNDPAAAKRMLSHPLTVKFVCPLHTSLFSICCNLLQALIARMGEEGDREVEPGHLSPSHEPLAVEPPEVWRKLLQVAATHTSWPLVECVDLLTSLLCVVYSLDEWGTSCAQGKSLPGDSRPLAALLRVCAHAICREARLGGP